MRKGVTRLNKKVAVCLSAFLLVLPAAGITYDSWDDVVIDTSSEGINNLFDFIDAASSNGFTSDGGELTTEEINTLYRLIGCSGEGLETIGECKQERGSYDISPREVFVNSNRINIRDQDENTETVTREFELLGEPFDEEFEVNPNGNWELTGEVEREDGFIDLGRPHPSSGESFELILGTSVNEFEVVRPDFSVTTDVDSDVVSVGREINVGFDDESKDRYSDIEDRFCSARIEGEEITGRCSFKVSEEDIGNQDNAEVTIKGSLIDNTPGSGLGATDTTDLDVARPMPWEESTISLADGESEEFSPSVSCEDQVRISYSGNSISMESGSLSKSRGTPGEGTSISLGDFSLEVENRDSNGDLEVTPRCGPEVDYVASEDGSNNLDDSPSDCAEDEYYDHGFDTCLEDYN